MYWVQSAGYPIVNYGRREGFTDAVVFRVLLERDGKRVCIRDDDGVTTCCESSSVCICYDREGMR